MNSVSSFRSIYFLVIIFSGLANIVLGTLVLVDSPRRKVNRLFSLLCLILTVWAISFVGFNLSQSLSSTYVWSRLYTVSLLFMAPVYYHLILGSLGNSFKGQDPANSPITDRVKQLSYVFSTGWFLLTLSGVFPQVVEREQEFSFPLIGQQFWIAALIYLSLTIVSIVILLRAFFSSRDHSQKSRLVYLLIGSVTILIGGVSDFMLIHTPHLSPEWLIPVGHLVSSLCLVFVAYALTTSQLYHFSELFRKAIAFLFMTFILLSVFGGTHFISSKILLPYIPRSDYFALGMASIAMSLLFHPLRFRVQNLVDKIFFAKRFDQMQRLRGLSRRVLSSADREELLNVLFTSLKGIGFGSVSLLLKDPQKPIFHVKKGLGLSDKADGFFLKTDSLLIQYLREEKQELIRDEVTRRIMADWERQALNDEMEILQSEISFPLFSTRRRALFGVICLGKSELGYSSYKGRNIFWLKSLIDNAGIMLDNFYHQEFANALIPYVGRTWADEMRRNKEGFRERLAGHRTWVSVLMVDIRHFTTMSSRMDPQDVVNLLKDFRLQIAPIVYRYQGTIDKFIGDAVMIVFGLPILPALANPDKNAVECSLAIMKEIEELNNQRFEAGQKERISIGMGVSSGEVIAGNVDSGDRVEYTVIGDAANMVARLEDLAGDNQILLSPATYARTKDYFEVKPWASRTITGYSEPVTVYELFKMKETSEPVTMNPDKPNSFPSSPSSARLAANQ